MNTRLKPLQILDNFFKFLDKSEQRESKPSGVLLLSCGGLGDTILFSHIIDHFIPLVKRNEAISVLIRDDSIKTAFLLPDTVKKITVNFHKLKKNLFYRKKIMQDLYHHNFRMVISTDYLRHPRLDEALILACQAPETAAMVARPWEKYQKLLDENARYYKILYDSGDKVYNKIARWVDFANSLTGANRPPPKTLISPKLLPTPLSEQRPLVIINPFSAVREKESPLELYETIIDNLASHIRIIITGTSKDLAKHPNFERLFRRKNVEFFDATFVDLLPKILAAKIVISVDTALMHLAVASGAPTLCLASAAYVGEIVPYSEETKPSNAFFCYVPMKCQGCLGKCHLSPINDMFPCVAKLRPSEILEKINYILRLNKK